MTQARRLCGASRELGPFRPPGEKSHRHPTATFSITVDLVLADGEASTEERKFIDGLQGLLQLPDEDAVKIVDVISIKNSV
jgi:hypothetical protein